MSEGTFPSEYAQDHGRQDRGLIEKDPIFRQWWNRFQMQKLCGAIGLRESKTGAVTK